MDKKEKIKNKEIKRLIEEVDFKNFINNNKSMKHRRIPAIGMLVSMGVAVLTAVFETSMNTTTAENIYGLVALGLIAFGIWSSVLLLKK